MIEKVKNLGARIQQHRKAAGLSQKQLADKIGLQPNTIAFYESDRTVPSLPALMRISQTLNVSIDTLLDNKPFNQENVNHNVFVSLLTEAGFSVSQFGSTSIFHWRPNQQDWDKLSKVFSPNELKALKDIPILFSNSTNNVRNSIISMLHAFVFVRCGLGLLYGKKSLDEVDHAHSVGNP